MFTLPDEGKCRIFGVSSASRGEGKSTTSINLAHVIAESGKRVLLIDADLSAELSLSKLAEEQKISAGYLATLFKKETGLTVSEAIRKKRIALALHLLHTTNLQIQTIAMHCGIMDVQYFSKTFKKQVGKTPKEYRDSIRA
jgi:YesN/AraC family two-component response regulator